jgi:TPP-dependent pyruvate/acetoin dehydrogenase alpha subunit
VGRSIAAMASGLGMPAYSVEGNDVASVYAKVSEALSEIRAGGGPRLIELSTYRWLEHCGPSYDNHIGYRSESEFLEWQAKEPIARFEKVMLDNLTITTAELQLMNDNISLEVEEAFTFAEVSPMPSADRAYTGLYSEQSVFNSAPQSKGS